MTRPENTQQPAVPSCFETHLIDLLYDLDSGAVEGFFIDKVDKSEANEGEAAGADNETIAKIDALCETLGIGKREWAAAFIGGAIVRPAMASEQPVSERYARTEERHGHSIGKFVVGVAWNALPVEFDETGEGNARLMFRCAEGVLVLRSEGWFGTERGESGDEENMLVWTINYEADVISGD